MKKKRISQALIGASSLLAMSVLATPIDTLNNNLKPDVSAGLSIFFSFVIASGAIGLGWGLWLLFWKKDRQEPGTKKQGVALFVYGVLILSGFAFWFAREAGSGYFGNSNTSNIDAAEEVYKLD